MGEGAGEAELEAGEVFMSSRRQPMAPRYPSCWQKRAFIAPLDLEKGEGERKKYENAHADWLVGSKRNSICAKNGVDLPFHSVGKVAIKNGPYIKVRWVPCQACLLSFQRGIQCTLRASPRPLKTFQNDSGL